MEHRVLLTPATATLEGPYPAVAFRAIPSRLAQVGSPLGALVYFHPRYKGLPGVPRGPTLLVQAANFDNAQRAVHEGAFGNDSVVVCPGWLLLWKFPADALAPRLSGYALPVGTYPTDTDPWAAPWTPSVAWGPAGGGGGTADPPAGPPPELCTKLRYDFPAGDGVHCLQRAFGKRVAMMISMLLCRGFWDISPAEQGRVKRLCQGLASVGVVAAPCYAMHHAIIFSTWRLGGTVRPLAPSELSVQLSDPRLMAVFEAALGPEAAREWAARHRSAFPARHRIRHPRHSIGTLTRPVGGGRFAPVTAHQLKNDSVVELLARPNLSAGTPMAHVRQGAVEGSVQARYLMDFVHVATCNCLLAQRTRWPSDLELEVAQRGAAYAEARPGSGLQPVLGKHLPWADRAARHVATRRPGRSPSRGLRPQSSAASARGRPALFGRASARAPCRAPRPWRRPGRAPAARAARRRAPGARPRRRPRAGAPPRRRRRTRPPRGRATAPGGCAAIAGGGRPRVARGGRRQRRRSHRAPVRRVARRRARTRRRHLCRARARPRGALRETT